MRLAKLKIIVNHQSIYGYFPPEHIYVVGAYLSGTITNQHTLHVAGTMDVFDLDMPLIEVEDEINAALRDELITME